MSKEDFGIEIPIIITTTTMAILAWPIKKLFDHYKRDADGYDKDGYDKLGYDRNGYDKNGFDKDGFSKSGLDLEGFDRDGYNVCGINRANYTIEGAQMLLMEQRAEYQKAVYAFEQKENDIGFTKCRRIMECVLQYICKVENLYNNLPTHHLIDKIKTCQVTGIISDAFADQLHEARKYCNNLHYSEQQESYNNIKFSYLTVKELLDFWEERYIQPHSTSFC